MHTYDQIMADLKKKIYKPVYYLMGEESYFIDEVTHYIENNVLAPDERAFNQTIIYGKDVELGTVINAAKRFPMMSNHNVVIVKEAQNLKGIDGAAADAVDPFLLYVEKPLNSTILVINYRGKSLDKRKKLFKAIEKSAVIMESNRIYENKVGPWITEYLKNKGYGIELRAAEMMASHLGNDLSKVANEIEKLVISLPKGATVTAKDIEENVGISKDFNVFELQTALTKKDVYRANLIITHMAQNPKTKSIIPLIAILYGYFTKILSIHTLDQKTKPAIASLLGINPFFADEYLLAAQNFPRNKCVHIIGFLRDYDTKAKGIDCPAIDDADLMRELVYKILHI